MKRIKPIFAVAAIAALAVGCAATDAQDQSTSTPSKAEASGQTAPSLTAETSTDADSLDASAPATTSPSTPASATPTPLPTTKEELDQEVGTGVPEKSERGAVRKKVGVSGGASDSNGNPTIIFRVNKIDTSPECSGSATAPENGRLIALHMDIQTTKALGDADLHHANPFDWEYLGADGAMFNGDIISKATFGCFPKKDLMPESIGPARKATGLVVLDVPEGEGILVFGQSFVDGGWEYKLP